MSTAIVGISAYYHDSAAALLKDGQLIAAAQEERFSRRKGDPAFPSAALKYCLREGGIAESDLDMLVFYEKPLNKFDRLLNTFRHYRHEAWPSFREAWPQWARQKLQLDDILREEMGPEFRGDICFSDHHESHAASAFFPSPFSSAAVLTMDAVGEWSTSSIGFGRDNRVELLQEMRFPHSLGMLYSAFTYYTGFKVNSGEYKMMGLAPYGDPIYVDLILDRLVNVRDDGSLSLDLSYFNFCQGLTMTSGAFHDLFGGPPRDPETEITKRHRDIAASIQVVTEEVVLRAARHAREITNERNVVLAGGVALNCVANGRLLRENIFDDIWIQPAAGDAGGALGAAYLGWHHIMGAERRTVMPDAQRASYLGPAYSDSDIQVFLRANDADFEHFESEQQLLEAVTSQLMEGRVVGWFHGRMEFGPRALGSRSIIGDPRIAEMQQKMNLKIKFRESFRPFAPSVLQEHAPDLFELPEQIDSPYMLMVAPVREHLRCAPSTEEATQLQGEDLCARASVVMSSLPAITHVDYSARVQTVDPERHGRYYRLIRRFFERTGCPAVINTSFNIRGEPIVCTPADALHCFLATDMDCLVLGNQVLYKDRQHSAAVSSERYRAQHAPD